MIICNYDTVFFSKCTPANTCYISYILHSVQFAVAEIIFTVTKSHQYGTIQKVM